MEKKAKTYSVMFTHQDYEKMLKIAALRTMTFQDWVRWVTRAFAESDGKSGAPLAPPAAKAPRVIKHWSEEGDGQPPAHKPGDPF